MTSGAPGRARQRGEWGTTIASQCRPDARSSHRGSAQFPSRPTIAHGADAAAHGSQQLRIFRRAMRAGFDVEDAAEMADIGLGEARLIAAEDLKSPPPPAAFELLYDPDAPVAASNEGNDDMARGRAARTRDDDGGEIAVKDFAGAVRLWRNDIKPAISKVGEHNQEAGNAYKAIKKGCHIQPAAAKLAFKLDGMEEAKRDDFLRCLTGLLKELNIPLESNDLVDRAEKGEAPAPRPKPKLVTVPTGPADDSDLGDPSGIEPQTGTGAAAIKAMNDDAAKKRRTSKTSAVDQMRADHAADAAEEDFDDFDGPPPRNPPAED